MSARTNDALALFQLDGIAVQFPGHFHVSDHVACRLRSQVAPRQPVQKVIEPFPRGGRKRSQMVHQLGVADSVEPLVNTAHQKIGCADINCQMFSDFQGVSASGFTALMSAYVSRQSIFSRSGVAIFSAIWWIVSGSKISRRKAAPRSNAARSEEHRIPVGGVQVQPR